MMTSPDVDQGKQVRLGHLPQISQDWMNMWKSWRVTLARIDVRDPTKQSGYETNHFMEISWDILEFSIKFWELESTISGI